MDITKYIALFLLKNHFCYIHGLGNLELIRIKASLEGDTLQAPAYTVTITPGGSIDDNLANFIATNEQISISKAANALREFSTQARKDLTQGKEIVIPNIGKLVEHNGKVKFVTDENFKFTPSGIPTIKNSKQLDEQNLKLAHKPAYPPPSKADSINWSMIILVAILLLVLAGGGYGIYYYKSTHKPSIPVVDATLPKDTVKATAVAEPDTLPPHVDTVNSPASVMAPPIADSMTQSRFKMIIGDYHTRERAEKRIKNLTLNGNQVEMVQKDSTDFLVITTISCRSVDTTHVKDSLKALFGFKGVALYK
jgi:nucleoid DNA-binding protein